MIVVLEATDPETKMEVKLEFDKESADFYGIDIEPPLEAREIISISAQLNQRAVPTRITIQTGPL